MVNLHKWRRCISQHPSFNGHLKRKWNLVRRKMDTAIRNERRTKEKGIRLCYTYRFFEVFPCKGSYFLMVSYWLDCVIECFCSLVPHRSFHLFWFHLIRTYNIFFYNCREILYYVNTVIVVFFGLPYISIVKNCLQLIRSNIH